MAEIVYLDTAFTGLEAIAGTACAFGVFDGYHKGHQFLIEETILDARSRNCPAVAVTFDIDPDELFAKNGFVKLASNGDRVAALAASGVDRVVVFTFTREFAALEPSLFLETAFGTYTPASLHVGSDFRFGFKAQGTLSDLVSWGNQHNMNVVGHNLATLTGIPITATRIRSLLATGTAIEEANELLGRPYRLSGPVTPGRQDGRTFGFKTANVSIEPSLRALGEGVYAAYCAIDGTTYKAAVSVGVSPTFEDVTNAFCEAHILDFDGDLYGRVIALDFISWLRPMIKFSSKQELIDTVLGNINWVRNNL